MSKMGSHCSFGHIKHKLWPKERPGVKLSIFGNWPDLLSLRQRATYRWKGLDESYNFALDRTSIRGLFTKLWGSKVAGVSTSAISGLPRGSPGREKPFGCKPRCRNPTLAKCGGEAQHLEKMRIWSPLGLPNVQSSTARPETPRIGGVLGVIGKVLKRRYRKWPRIGHLDICRPSYGQKKGRDH